MMAAAEGISPDRGEAIEELALGTGWIEAQGPHRE